MSTGFDPDGGCSTCRGRGYVREQTERGTFMNETCWACDGTGSRGVRVLRPAVETEATR